MKRTAPQAPTPELTELTLSVSIEAWRHHGFATDTLLAGVRLRLEDGGGGLAGWAFSALGPDVESIDGIATTAHSPNELGQSSDAPFGAIHIDHVVVATDDLARTTTAIERATTAPMKRVRDAGPGVRQGFFRFGDAARSVVVEVVERADSPAGPARLWGLVFVVDDVEEIASRAGPSVIGAPKPAVQPGRLIATVRPEAGLGIPVALMSPDPRWARRPAG